MAFLVNAHMNSMLMIQCRMEGPIPPYSPDSPNFKGLEENLRALKKGLPDDLRLTARNTQDQFYYRKCWEKYALINAILTICTVFLYREYMAYSPWTLLAPKGPLDPPMLDLEPPLPRPDYWLKQARRCWKACRAYAEFLLFCKQHGFEVETPIVAFAAYSVGWCGRSLLTIFWF